MQKEYTGFNSIGKIDLILNDLKSQKILIFSGKNSFISIKRQFLKHIFIEFDMYNNFQLNPKLEEVEQAVAKHYVNNYDAIIAIGGGSVIDFAKAYRYYTESTIPLIAIPTTAGTGSESTQFAVIYVDGIKQSIDEPSILPDYIILDSQFLFNSPKYIKACSAIDAYCQAIESYWSILSTNESKKNAKKAILLIKENIGNFVNSNNMDAATKMLYGANLAGKAINISKTTAAHALSYKITSDYNLPHGHAVALVMKDLFEANLQTCEINCQDSRGYRYVQDTMAEILDMLNLQKDEFSQYWYNLMNCLGLEYDLQKLNINDYENIINSVNQQRLKNNPKDLTKDLITFFRNY